MSAFFASLHGAVDEERIEDVLHTVRLWEARHMKSKQYSKGMLQRLGLAIMLYYDADLLILDEPTNHLDIRSKDILKKALLAYDGTLILVSHDRDFLHGLAETIYEFKDKKVKQYRGDITYFLEKLKLENMRQFELQGNKQPTKPETVTASSSKQDYLQKKEREKVLRKLKSAVEKSEKRIAELEEDLSNIHKKLELPENQTDMDLFKRYDEVKAALDEEMEVWEKATEDYEKENA